MVLSRREILLGGLAALTVAATGSGAVPPRRCRRSQVACQLVVCRHGSRQRRHLPQDELRQGQQEVAQQIVKYTAPSRPARWSSIRGTISFTSSWRTRRRSATASASARKGSSGTATPRSTASPVAEWAPPPEMRSGGRSCRRSSPAGRPTIRSARARCISIATAATQATGCMARSSRGASAPTRRAAASACSPGHHRPLPAGPIGTPCQVLPHIADQADKAKRRPSEDRHTME